MVVQDRGLQLRYVLANEADVYLAADNVTQFGYTTVVDAVKQQVTRLPSTPFLETNCKIAAQRLDADSHVAALLPIWCLALRPQPQPSLQRSK